MKRAKSMQSWSVALGIVLMAVVLAGCPAGQKNYPTQPAARNVVPGIETGPVEASFECSADSADPLTLVCRDTSTGSIDSWFWEFGDGRTSSAQNPRHTYKEAGSYVVVLTISGQAGTDSGSAVVNVGDSGEEGGL